MSKADTYREYVTLALQRVGSGDIPYAIRVCRPITDARVLPIGGKRRWINVPEPAYIP